MQQLGDLKVLLLGLTLLPISTDKWKWVPNTNGFFSVKSCYSLLLQHRQVEPLDDNVLVAINKSWGNDVPSKISFFGWRLLLQRLPTRPALHRRGILLNPLDLNCVFCAQHVEDTAHLFFSCSFTKGVWEEVSRWIGKQIPSCVDGWRHFLLFGDLVKVRKGGRVKQLFWLGTTWNIWKLRNNVVFKGSTPEVSTLVDEIKTFSWIWYTGRYGRNSCSPFSSWCINLIPCIQSISQIALHCKGMSTPYAPL
jgi:hypothetical protein